AALYLPPDPPTISSFCPPSGDPGTIVQIDGAGFLPVTEVRLNGQPVSFTKGFNFVLNVTVPQGATTGPIEVTSPYGKATTATSLIVPNGLTPIETWRVLNFGSPANSATADDLADPDGDGLVNLHEYHLHTNPKASDPTRGLIALRGVEIAGQRFFEFAIRRYALASDIT